MRLPALLGFFHGFFLNIIQKLNLDLDTFMLNLKITDYIERPREQNPQEMKLEINKINLLDIFATLRATVEHPNTSEFQLMYLFGFSQALLNRIMRKLGIAYQIPPPV
ncbi:MAG: hypothetical protein ACFFD7_17280 [Candidatus Thorarchaeota archaeon]